MHDDKRIQIVPVVTFLVNFGVCKNILFIVKTKEFLNDRIDPLIYVQLLCLW
jgi:hypothetical protein